MSPVRVQRQRTPGWRKPEHTVYVGRGSVWGNPFVVGEPSGVFPEGMGLRGAAEVLIPALTLDQCVEFYSNAVEGYLKPEMYPAGHAFSERLRPHASVDMLRGKNLMCWCALDQPCHADVLLKLANPSAQSPAVQTPIENAGASQSFSDEKSVIPNARSRE